MIRRDVIEEGLNGDAEEEGREGVALEYSFGCCGCFGAMSCESVGLVVD